MAGRTKWVGFGNHPQTEPLQFDDVQTRHKIIRTLRHFNVRERAEGIDKPLSV